MTGAPYPPQIVKRADFARVMAEFWADGPKSETPPGPLERARERRRRRAGLLAQALRRGRAARPARVGRSRRTSRSTAPSTTRRSPPGISSAATRPCAPSRSFAGWERRGSRRTPAARRTTLDGSAARPGPHRSDHERRAARRGSGTRSSRFYVGEIAIRDWRGEPGDRTARGLGRGLGARRRLDHVPAADVRDARVPGVHLGPQHLQPRRRGGARDASPAARTSPAASREYVAPKDTFLVFEKGPSAGRAPAVGVAISTRRIRRASRASGAASTSSRTTSWAGASGTRSGSTR